MRPIDPDALLMKSATFSRPVVFAYVATPQALRERAQRVFDALAAGVLPAPRLERFTLDGAREAHERLESRASSGALVLVT